MNAANQIRAAINRCIEANPEPSDGSDIAAAVLWAAAEGIEHSWDGADCVDHLQALAQQLNDTALDQPTTTEGPAVPEVREPVAVAEEPSDEELLALVPQGSESDFYLPQGLPSNWIDGDFIAPPEAVVAFARAVLARYGHQPAPPAEGEVAKLVEWLRGANWDSKRQTLATRAADLLSQRHPTPVPVSERLPGPEDCLPWPGEPNAGRWCWMASCVDNGWAWEQRTLGFLASFPQDFTHWLPAHAMPLPNGEVE